MTIHDKENHRLNSLTMTKHNALMEFILLLTVSFGSLHSSQGSRPHIVLMVADDLGWNDVGFHGSEIKTPYIDNLAYEGVILNNYYVSPICTPTRGSLMTGRHPIHLGLQHSVIAAACPWGLPLGHKTMAQHLKRLGYVNHIIGKWHLGFFQSDYLPTSRGFDSHFGYWGGKEDYNNHIDEDVYTGLDFRRNMQVVNKTGYSTELYTEEAKSIIDAHNTSEPLFLYMAYQAVHAGNGNDPIQAPQAYIDRFPYIADEKRRKFAGVTAALDDSVGSVVRALRKKGMLDNTIIVFTTDNGGPANNYDSNAACNSPLRGTKNTMWEGGVHGVGFVHSKLLQKHRYISNNLLHVSDWLPTLYSAAGGSISELGTIDGMDMWKMLSTNGPAVRHEVLHNIDPASHFSAIRVGDYKLVQGDISGGRNDMWYPCNPPRYENASNYYADPDTYSFIQSENIDIKIHINKRESPHTPINIDCGNPPENYTKNCEPKKAPCLFHIPTDPCEYKNIADKSPEIVQVLLDRIKVYASGAVKPVNKPADPAANPKYHGGVWSPWKDNTTTLTFS